MEANVKPVKQIVDETVSFISHSEIIAEKSPYYKSNKSFMASMQACRKIKRWLASFKGSYPTKTVCRELIQNSGHLFNIVPSAKNESFESSARKINELIEAARLKIQSVN